MIWESFPLSPVLALHSSSSTSFVVVALFIASLFSQPSTLLEHSPRASFPRLPASLLKSSARNTQMGLVGFVTRIAKQQKQIYERRLIAKQTKS
jgi:hypothetical protein